MRKKLLENKKNLPNIGNEKENGGQSNLEEQLQVVEAQADGEKVIRKRKRRPEEHKKNIKKNKKTKRRAISIKQWKFNSWKKIF